ncbi:hypothetical protein JHK82_029270 [Glycine max]|nr:hypothetical protein JHK82_029270 [Glycine max]
MKEEELSSECFALFRTLANQLLPKSTGSGLTGLPPYIGMLLGLGMLWILTDAIHYDESERQKLKVPHALSRIDTQGALFFLGIVLSVSR